MLVLMCRVGFMWPNSISNWFRLSVFARVQLGCCGLQVAAELEFHGDQSMQMIKAFHDQAESLARHFKSLRADETTVVEGDPAPPKNTASRCKQWASA